MNQLKYDSLYSGLVSINRSLGGYQPMPDSEYGAMIDLMETLSNRPVGESGDVFDAVSTVATMAESGELPIQGGEVPSGCRLGFRSVNINENGYQEFHATNFDLDGFSTIGVDVNVTAGDKDWWYDSGMKFAYSSIESIPSWFDPSKVTNGYRLFSGAPIISSIGDLRFEYLSNAQFMFAEMTSIRSVGNITIGKRDGDPLSTDGMFYNNMSLVEIGSLNMKPTGCMNMFGSCLELQSVPLFDTSEAYQIDSMFSNCSKLQSVPLFDFSSAFHCQNVFSYCQSLKTIPQFNFSKAGDIYNLLGGCTSLESVPILDFSRVQSGDVLFGWDEIPNLTDVGGFMNMKFNSNNFITNCPNLTVESLMNIINNLWDWRETPDGTVEFEDGTGISYGTEHYLGFGETNLTKLTPDQIAVATNKGWMLT